MRHELAELRSEVAALREQILVQNERLRDQANTNHLSRTIEGRVYLEAKGGRLIALGPMVISVYESESLTQFWVQIEAERDKKIKNLQTLLEIARDSDSKNVLYVAAIEERMRNAMKERRFDEHDTLAKELIAFRQSHPEKVSKIEREMKSVRSMEFAYDRLPATSSKLFTKDDGAFALKTNAESSITLAVKAGHPTLPIQYYWITKFPVSGTESTTILLNNENVESTVTY